MSSLLANILRQALKTFDRTNQAKFAINFAALKQLTEELTYRDLHLHPSQLNDDAFVGRDRAPCTFIHIFENDLVSLSVFVMRNGFSLPIHDHPMMYGILKGISGQMRVQSFEPQIPSGQPYLCDNKSKEISVIAEDPQTVGPDSECAVLTPYERNIHEVTAIDGAAAFFDILSPPYDTDIPGFGVRKCHYYGRQKVDGDGDVGKVEVLRRIPAPSYYYCDTADATEAVAECYSVYQEAGYGSGQ